MENVPQWNEQLIFVLEFLRVYNRRESRRLSILEL